MNKKNIIIILVAAVIGIGICIFTYFNANNTFTNREILFEERTEDGEKVFEALVEVPVVKDGETGENHPLNAKTGRRVTECLSAGDGYAVSHTFHRGEDSGLSAVEILSSYKEEIGDENYYERFIYPRFSLLNNGAHEPIPQGVVNMGTYAYEDITAVNFDGHEIHLRAYVTRVNNGDYLLSCVMDAVDMGEFNARYAYAQKERLCKIIEKQATKKF